MEDRVVPIEKAAPVSLFDFGANLGKAWEFASVLAKSQIIPDTFRGNTASCLIALDMANRMRRNPLEVMQAMYIVHGKPSFSSSFLISLINSCGYYEPLRFEFKGEGEKRSCMAWTVDKRTGDKIEGPEISMQMAKDDGWYGKNPKWKTMPEVMLRYRAASFFSRAYCPDLTGGFHSAEEARDEQLVASIKTESSTDIEAELLAQSQKAISATAEKKPESQPNLAPIDPDMIPLDDVPVAQSAQPAINGNGTITEVEKLRTELMTALTINLTAEEAEAWCMRNYGKEFKKLAKDELRAAVVKINDELDKRM